MIKINPVAALCVVLWTLPLGAASAADDATTLRNELEALKSEYSKRVTALETRITELENAASAAAALGDTAAAAAAVAPAPAPPIANGKGGAAAFNPAMSVILAGNYASLSQDPATFNIAGFIPSGGEVGPGERSFNLGESELTLSANVDPYFFANLTAAIDSANEIGVEEAYFRTLALPAGFTLKGGRFFSGVGYLNEIHAHAWDFIDQPLAYQAFFGGQLAQDGVQLRWIAPTDLFLEFGAETGSGRRFPGTDRNSNALNGNALLAHVGGDVGDSTSWRAGISWLDDRADGRAYEDTDAAGFPVVNTFTGTSRTWVVDATMKWAPHGNPTQHQLKLQGEYLQRKERGQLLFDADGASLGGGYSSNQSGWYVQSVYQFRPRWRAGARYDSLHSGSPSIGLVGSGLLPRVDFPALLGASPERETLMLDYNPSEFTRLRLQYAWDDSRDLPGERDRELFLQYQYGIGAHGAHKF
jgi:hypothetical protein